MRYALRADSALRSDIGCDRDNNEDTFFGDENLGLWLVADGMGGHDCGEVASAIARDKIVAEVKSGKSLVEAILLADKEVIIAGNEGKGRPGMGTTVVVLRIEGDQYEVAWVGDSRAYLYSDGLIQISKDHSYVQKLIDIGKITPEQAENFPNKNIITQALGTDNGDKIRVDVVTGQLKAGERILLCSDGLNDAIRDDDIEKLLSSEQDTAAIADNLIQAALDNNGGDNITAVVVALAVDEAGEGRNCNDVMDNQQLHVSDEGFFSAKVLDIILWLGFICLAIIFYVLVT